MGKYNVWGRFTIEVNFNIESENQESANKKAIFFINDMYHIDCYGAYHDPKNGVDLKSIYVDEIDETPVKYKNQL